MSVTSQSQQKYYIKLVLNTLWKTDCFVKIACNLRDLKKSVTYGRDREDINHVV